MRYGIKELNKLSIKPENYKIVRKHLFRLLGHACVHCGSINNLELDHIIPNGYQRNKVGTSKRVFEWIESYDKENLQLLCAKCNKVKSDKLE